MRAALVLVLFTACDQVYGLNGRADAMQGDGSITAGLVAHYTMDEIQDVLEDATGNNNVGLCNQSRCPREAATAKVGKALHFDGTIAIGVNPDAELDTSAGFTIAGWYNPVGDTFSCPFNKVAQGGANSWQLCLPSRRS